MKGISRHERVDGGKSIHNQAPRPSCPQDASPCVRPRRPARKVLAMTRRKNLGRPAGLDSWTSLREAATFAGDDFALFAGDAASSLAQLPDGSINTCLT